MLHIIGGKCLRPKDQDSLRKSTEGWEAWEEDSQR